MKVQGVAEAKADAGGKTAWVKYDAAKVQPAQLVETINTKTNFKASLSEQRSQSAVVHDFSLPDLEGKQVKLSEFKGKVLLVDFWATWCEPCITEIPHFNKLHAMYQPRGLEIVGVTLDSGSANDVRKHVSKHKIQYRVLMGNDKVSNQYDILGFPTTYLIGRDWTVFRKYVGVRSGKEQKAAALEKDIESLL